MQGIRTMYTGIGAASVGLLLIVCRLFFATIGLVGSVGLLLYVVGIAMLASYVLYRICFLQLQRVSTWGIGLTMTIISMGMLLAIPIIFAQLTSSGIVLSLFSLLALYTVLALVARTSHQAPHPIARKHIPGWHAADLFTAHRLWFVLYGVFWLFGLSMLLSQASSDVLLSPWQSLPTGYLTAVAVCGLILLCLLFSRIKTKWLLLLIVLQSVLMHVYIPASHVLPAGGDIWRHIGRVELILSGEPINPVLFGDTASFETVGPIVVPSVFLQPQQYAYGAQWGLMAAWKAITGYELLGVSKWGVPLLWPTAVPILFFYIGYLLFRSQRHALVISIASLVPFSMLALGSLSLPVTIGYIACFTALLLLLIAMRYGTRLQWTLVVLSGIGLLFVYPLHALLFLVTAVIGGLFYRIRDRMYDTARPVLVVGFVLLLSPLLPLVELTAGMSSIPVEGEFWLIRTLVRIVSEHSGWYIASEIRPHDILSGNILFNHVPDWAFVEHLFTNVRWPLMLFVIGVYGFALYGWIMSIIKEKRTTWQMLTILAAVVWGGYGFSWYFLSGEHQLVRRLDVMFAFLLILFGWYGLTVLIDRYTHSTKAALRIAILLLTIGLFGWWGSMSAFTLGPDMRYVSTDEYRAGAYVAGQLDDTSCVLADTWPLLVIEAKTAGRSIGGGFPITEQYSQLERVTLYEKALNTPSSTIWSDIAAVHDDDRCMLVLPINDPVQIRTYETAFGTSTLVGDFVVWQQELPKEE